MLRRPPRSTRTDTLFPYTTLFRSGPDNPLYAGLVTLNPSAALLGDIIAGSLLGLENSSNRQYDPATTVAFIYNRDRNIARQRYSGVDFRSEERRVGKECGSTLRARVYAHH